MRASTRGLLALSLGLLPGSLLAIPVVVDGKAVATIVTPDKPLPVETYSAVELRYHVKQATGIDLTVATESAAPAGPAIFLGATNAAKAAGLDGAALGRSNYRIKGDAERLFLVGSDTDGPVLGGLTSNRTRVGTLFAVYDLLENEMGVRWLWPGRLGEVIPKATSIQFGNLDRTEKSPFLFRRWRDGGALISGPGGWSNPENQRQYSINQSVWLRRQRFAYSTDVPFGHAFGKYWERFGTSNPEFFQMLPDGQRRPDPSWVRGNPGYISLAVAEPGLWRQIVRDWEGTRNGSVYLNACENDTPGMSVSPRELAWDTRDEQGRTPEQRAREAGQAFDARDPRWWLKLGSVSDRYARFYREVQREAEKVDPNVVVVGYAYANYKDAPREAKLNDRVLIGIVPDATFPWTPQVRSAFDKQYMGWKDTGAMLFLRPNFTLQGHNMPIAYARAVGEMLRKAAANNLVGVDLDSLTGQWGTQGPTLYVIARAQVRPDLTVDAMLDEYYSAFGPAKDAVRAYFDYWEKFSDGLTEDQFKRALDEASPDGSVWANFHRVAPLIFTDRVMEDGRKLLDAAARAAGSDADARARVKFLQDGLRNAELTLQAQRDFASGGAGGMFSMTANNLSAFRASIEASGVANMTYLTWAETRTWGRR